MLKRSFGLMALVFTLSASVAAQDKGGDLTMAVIGFEQAGASGAKSDQKFFFDFFTSRPLPFFTKNVVQPFGPPIRWWGDVRIASYPQQVTTRVAEFASSFASQVGNLKVNEVAQFGEFRAGLDFRLKAFGEDQQFVPNLGAAKQQSSLSFFVGFGALGAFNPPSERMDIFQVPPAGSPQAAAFERNFPAVEHPDLRLPATQFVGISTPDRNRFYRQYGGGFRLTTRFYDDGGNLLPAPAMVAFAVGQHELISGGAMRGVAGKFEGFYPLSIGKPGSDDRFVFYLFGRANLSFGRAVESTPLVLQRAIGIQPDNPAVAVIAQPSARDSYTIGIGLDAAQLITKLIKR